MTRLGVSEIQDQVFWAVNGDRGVNIEAVANELVRRFGCVPISIIDDRVFWSVVRKFG